jgi:UDP-N-acetylmuramoylalanine--D-glutamate ligase
VRIFSDDIVQGDSTDGEYIRISGQTECQLSQTNFSGIHNAMNILACTLVANEIGISSEQVKEYLQSITGLPHRLEKIGEK